MAEAKKNMLTRVPVREQEPKVRATNFEEVCLGYNEEEAVEEAQRCLHCKNAKCIQGCPVNINIPDFIGAVKERDFGTLLFRLVFLLSSTLGKKTYRWLRHSLGINKPYDTAIAYRVGFPNEIVAWTVKSKQKACWWHNGDYRYSESQTKALVESWGKMDHIISVSEGCKQMLIEKVPLVLGQQLVHKHSKLKDTRVL